jgi:hypothetical protein
MTFEEWWEDSVYPFIYEDCAKEAWEGGFDEGYKFANKENEEYDKTLTGDSAV